MRHPVERDLALRAGGETGRVHRFFLDRHLRNCEDCQEKVEQYCDLREQAAALETPDVDWNFLAREMKANIRVGLEAGACVRTPLLSRSWAPRFTMAFASLLVVIGASFFLTETGLHQVKAPEAAAPVLQATGSGIELRKGTESFTLSDRQGVRSGQTVNAQGVIEARYVNGETGSVTITNVYLQQ